MIFTQEDIADVVSNALIDLTSKAGRTKIKHTIQIETTGTPGAGTFEIWTRVSGSTSLQNTGVSFDATALKTLVVDGSYDQIEIRPNGVTVATAYSVRAASF